MYDRDGKTMTSIAISDPFQTAFPRMKVLIVEDNPISRKLTRVALEADGLSVTEAPDGKSAIDAVTREIPDLILQDILLPDIDGFDLFGRLRSLPGAEKTPILALTGLISKGDEARLPEANFADYLFKPVDPSFLVSTVRAHLAASKTSVAMPGHGRVVLAVDDDPKQLKLLATYLANLGFGVTTAKDGAEALAKAETTFPDAVISDVLMPRLDGFELCLAIRKHRRLNKIPVILLTNNYGDAGDKQLAADIGANALVMRTPDCKDGVEVLLASLNQPAPAPASDEDSFETGHRETLLRQLNRQARLSVDLARRCAAQSAQISVLASAAQNFLRSGQNIESLLAEILAHYLAVIGFSRGAVYLLDQAAGLKLSGQIGFSPSGETALADFFGSCDLFREAMSQPEPILFSAPAQETRYQDLLTRASVRSMLIAPLAFDERALGVIALFSDTRGLYPEWINFSKLINGQISQAVALWQTISQLKYLAAYDPLTALPNRARLIERVRELLLRPDTDIAILRVNIDGFEEINNALSYQKGDDLLRQFARRLEAAVGEADMLARLDADEFGVIFAGNGIAHEATERGRSILNALEAPFTIDNLPLDVHASIGVARAPGDARNAEDLLRRADMAMRAAKRSAAGLVTYTSAIDQYEPHRLTLMGELSYAIEHDELSLFYQPKVSFKTNRIVGVEALLRWQHPQRGLIPPDQFIPLAEKTGAIQRLTQWVIKTAVGQSALWRRAGFQFNVSLNLSVRNLLEPAFPHRVLEIIDNDGASAESLMMEITESALMADPAKARSVLIFLSQHGIRFSIDDFGTGYSSLAYLKHLPVREIKIDKIFVSNLRTDGDNTTIVRSTIELGHNLGLSVTAEGVEDQETWNILGALGCDEAQGYFMSKPLPVAQLEKWLNESKWGFEPQAAPISSFHSMPAK
jgi:diguanylate cyclase (GGDEF)-like protein